jgi:uncharacterized protein HemX
MSDRSFPTPPPQPSPARIPLLVLSVLLLLVATGLGYGWWKLRGTETVVASDSSLLLSTRAELAALSRSNQQLAVRLAAAEQAHAGLGQKLSATDQTLQDHGTQITHLEQTLLSAEQRYTLAGVEALLTLAADRISLERDRSTALAAMTMADERLATLSDPRLVAIRAALHSERAALEAAAVLDDSGASLQLAALIEQAPRWPLTVRAVQEFTPRPAAAPATVEGGWAAQLWQRLATALQAVVRIERNQGQVSKLLPPEQEALISHLLLSRLESARLAVLRRDDAAFASACHGVDALLQRYYRPEHQGVAAARATLRNLGKPQPQSALPVPFKALTALRALPFSATSSAPAKPPAP